MGTAPARAAVSLVDTCEADVHLCELDSSCTNIHTTEENPRPKITPGGKRGPSVIPSPAFTRFLNQVLLAEDGDDGDGSFDWLINPRRSFYLNG